MRKLKQRWSNPCSCQTCVENASQSILGRSERWSEVSFQFMFTPSCPATCVFPVLVNSPTCSLFLVSQFPQELEAPAIRLVHHSTSTLDELVAQLSDVHLKQQGTYPDWKPLTLPVLRRWVAKVRQWCGETRALAITTSVVSHCPASRHARVYIPSSNDTACLKLCACNPCEQWAAAGHSSSGMLGGKVQALYRNDSACHVDFRIKYPG